MKKSLNIQQTGLTNVRKSSLRSRIGLSLASSGIAGTLLLGGLFGFQGTPIASAHTIQRNAPTVSRMNKSTYQNIARQAARKAGINPQYFVNQIQQESGFNPWAVSPAGAEGIAQFMPATAASMGVNPWDPTSSLYGAARLMAQLSHQFGGDYAKALAGYNAGPGAVQYAVANGGGNWYAYLPAETQHYIAVILNW